MDKHGVIDFSDTSITQNTRVSYPIEHIENIQKPSIGKNPKNIFFLTADAFGVLPPISKLTPSQAAYHFISGYTAKVAGTEAGVTEPVPSFSACFGAPFMPLHPTRYAEMLSKKMKEAGVYSCFFHFLTIKQRLNFLMLLEKTLSSLKNLQMKK